MRITIRRDPSAARGRTALEPLAAKVPEITLMFWVVKLLTTFMGEVTSDYLGDVNVALGAVIELVLVVLGLWLQFRARRYVAAAYWFLAMAIAVFGTGVADAVHTAGIPYAGTSLLWAAILILIFWRWHRSEGTLSIHSIVTRRREKFYWATVFATFALGTALGDFTASALNLGYLSSGILFGAIFLIPAVARWGFGLNAVAAFWFAYVVTRPLGASFADYVSKPHAITGLNVGDGPTSGLSALVLVILVAALSLSRHGVQGSAAAGPEDPDLDTEAVLDPS